MGTWQITAKDLKLLARDRRAFTVLVLLPLAFIAILGLSTGRLLGWQSKKELLKVAVVTEDRSELAAEVVRALRTREALAIRDVGTWIEAERLVDSREVNAAFVIGADFSRRVEKLKLRHILDADSGPLAKGLPALDMDVETRSSAAGIRAIVGNLALSTAIQVIAPHVARKNRIIERLLKSSDEEASPETEEDTARPSEERHGSGQAPTGSHTQPHTDQIYETLVPGFTVMFAFFLVNIMARSFLSERETGTLQRLRIAPVTPTSVLLGKTIPFFIIALIQSCLLFLFGRLLFGMSWGAAPWLLIPIIVCTSAAATALGLLVATVVRTDSQVSAYANFLVITMAGISGCFMPRDWLPDVMRTVSLATPHAWALIAYDHVLNARFPEVAAIVPCCAALLAFSTLFFILGSWRFRTIS